MKIKDFLQRGRQLYACCPHDHDTLWPGGSRRVALDLTKFDPEIDHTELRGKVRCSVCGESDPRRVLLIPQTDRQMRQGRQR